MVILTGGVLPASRIISGFKGKIDFYYYMGVACVRRWPRNRGRSQTPDSVAQQPAFIYVSKLWTAVSPFVKSYYHTLTFDCGLHHKDWFTRGYYGKIYRYPTDYTPPP